MSIFAPICLRSATEAVFLFCGTRLPGCWRCIIRYFSNRVEPSWDDVAVGRSADRRGRVREREGTRRLRQRQCLPRHTPAFNALRRATSRAPALSNANVSRECEKCTLVACLCMPLCPNMSGLIVLLFVLSPSLVVAEKKMTIAEKLQEDADLSQVFNLKTFP